MVIRRIGVDAPLAVAVVGANGDMPEPPNVTTVVWYDFSAWAGLGGTPGLGGNAVFAGDYVQPAPEPEVFFRLSELAAGDTIELRLSDGRTLVYQVEFNKITPAANADFTTIVSATAHESMTLITAAGSASGGGTFSDRRIVWARRIA
jgi:LPXTG-site transpeptidase (sortase) family protein